MLAKQVGVLATCLLINACFRLASQTELYTSFSLEESGTLCHQCLCYKGKNIGNTCTERVAHPRYQVGSTYLLARQVGEPPCAMATARCTKNQNTCWRSKWEGHHGFRVGGRWSKRKARSETCALSQTQQLALNRCSLEDIETPKMSVKKFAAQPREFPPETHIKPMSATNTSSP